MAEASIQAPEPPLKMAPANSKSQDWQRCWAAMRWTQISVMLWDGSSILSYLWPYFFLSMALSLSLHLIIFGGFILFLKDTFHLIGIWSCGHYYKVQGWTHGKHMPDTCLPHVVHMYYCTLLCNAVCTAFSIVLLISFHFTYSAFHLTCQSCIPFTNLCHSCLLIIVISLTHCIYIFGS